MKKHFIFIWISLCLIIIAGIIGIIGIICSFLDHRSGEDIKLALQSVEISESETQNHAAEETSAEKSAADPETEPVKKEPEPKASFHSGKKAAPAESKQENAGSAFTACSSESLHYWLYTPSNPTDHMPLIVYLHGGSGKGDHLDLITEADGFPKYLKDGELGDVRAYVIIPQCPSSQKGWTESNDALYALIQSVVSQFKIDNKRISLTGHSMGGTGVWSLAATYPDLFARIAPLSGSVRNVSETAAVLKSSKVWTFVGSADTIVPPESSIEVITELKAFGGDASITIFEGADHFSVPALTYLDPSINLINWLIG